MSGVGGPGRHLILESASRSANTTATVYMGKHKAALITVDCTVDPAAGEHTPTIQLKDANGDLTTIWAAAAVTGVGTTSYYFAPGTIAADVNATEAAGMTLPDEFTFLMNVTSAGALTYSVSIERF